MAFSEGCTHVSLHVHLRLNTWPWLLDNSILLLITTHCHCGIFLNLWASIHENGGKHLKHVPLCKPIIGVKSPYTATCVEVSCRMQLTVEVCVVRSSCCLFSIHLCHDSWFRYRWQPVHAQYGWTNRDICCCSAAQLRHQLLCSNCGIKAVVCQFLDIFFGVKHFLMKAC